MYLPDVALENDLLRNLLVTDQNKMKIFADDRESYYSKEVLSVTSKEKVIGKVIILKNITEFQQLDEAKTNFIATISHELEDTYLIHQNESEITGRQTNREVNTEQKTIA